MIQPKAPAITDLMQAKKALVQLRDYLDSPEGAERALGSGNLTVAIDMVHLVIEGYHKATLIP